MRRWSTQRDAPAPRRRDRSAGFTLIEMLVGLSLLALIMSFLTPLLFEARRALRVVERPNLQAPISAAQAYLRSGLTQVYPAVPGVSGDQSRLGIAGTAQAFTYATTFAPQGVYQGLYVVTLQFMPNTAGGVDLVADEQIYRPATGGPDKAPSRRLVLVENVSSGRFGFYSSATSDEGPWLPAWPRSRTLPELVSIELTFQPGDERVWPLFWVRPAAAGASRVTCPPRVKCD
jgi:prepilin-type N-terminal cleavage/methylation domain-containing protein